MARTPPPGGGEREPARDLVVVDGTRPPVGGRDAARDLDQGVQPARQAHLPDMNAVPRSKLSAAMATRQPSFSLPTTLASGMRTLS
jgi:hypothetical protein